MPSPARAPRLPRPSSIDDSCPYIESSTSDASPPLIFVAVPKLFHALKCIDFFFLLERHCSHSKPRLRGRRLLFWRKAAIRVSVGTWQAGRAGNGARLV